MLGDALTAFLSSCSFQKSHWKVKSDIWINMVIFTLTGLRRGPHGNWPKGPPIDTWHNVELILGQFWKELSYGHWMAFEIRSQKCNFFWLPNPYLKRPPGDQSWIFTPELETSGRARHFCSIPNHFQGLMNVQYWVAEMVSICAWFRDFLDKSCQRLIITGCKLVEAGKGWSEGWKQWPQCFCMLNSSYNSAGQP